MEGIVGVGVYGKLYTLAQLYAAYIGFVNVGHYLHLCQVGSNGEEGRSFEAGSYGLSFFHILADDYTVDGRGDGGIRQVSFSLGQGCLAAVEGAFCLQVVIFGLFVVGVANEVLGFQSFVAFIVFLLILVFGFGTVVGSL